MKEKYQKKLKYENKDVDINGENNKLLVGIMTISATDVFDIISKYINKKYGDVESIKVPYCSLFEYFTTKKKVYRVQVDMKLKGDIFPFPKTAIAEIDTENGSVIIFKEGYAWDYWV